MSGILRIVEQLSVTADPQMLLLDLQLPGISGLALAQLDAGCDAYMTKPIDTRAPPIVVAELLAKRRSNLGAM